MKIVHGDEVEEVVRVFEHRKGVFRHRKLATEILVLGLPKLEQKSYHSVAAE